MLCQRLRSSKPLLSCHPQLLLTQHICAQPQSMLYQQVTKVIQASSFLSSATIADAACVRSAPGSVLSVTSTIQALSLLSLEPINETTSLRSANVSVSSLTKVIQASSRSR